VAHTCNSSYSGGRDQEDCCAKPVQGRWFARSYLEKNQQQQQQKNKAGGVAEMEECLPSKLRPSVQTLVLPKKKLKIKYSI
jgi:hypothetical protein